MSERYNGWANYETWRVNLEYFDGDDFERFDDYVQELYEDYEPPSWAPIGTPDEDRDRNARIDLAEILKDEVEEWICSHMPEEGCAAIARGWLLAFVADVRWTEIAAHIIDSIKERIEIPELVES
jgi:hypothetical protein